MVLNREPLAHQAQKLHLDQDHHSARAAVPKLFERDPNLNLLEAL